SEDKVAGRDFIAEGAALLGDAEWDLATHGGDHVFEVHEHRLGSLGPQVGEAGAVLHRTDEGLEHQVEGTRFRELALRATLGADIAFEVIGPEAFLAVAAVDHWVGESRYVAARFPDSRVHDDRSIDTDDVVAVLDDGFPPGPLDVV